MNKDQITFGVIGLLLGVIITWISATAAVNNRNVGMMRMMGMRMNMMDDNGMMGGTKMMEDDHNEEEEMDMSSAMQGMMKGLEGKTGDEFDKAFLAEMIMHHQGAIDMANAALKSAKHEEIKNMANNIISAQSSEINQMKEWQGAWYGIK